MFRLGGSLYHALLDAGLALAGGIEAGLAAGLADGGDLIEEIASALAHILHVEDAGGARPEGGLFAV